MVLLLKLLQTALAIFFFWFLFLGRACRRCICSFMMHVLTASAKIDINYYFADIWRWALPCDQLTEGIHWTFVLFNGWLAALFQLPDAFYYTTLILLLRKKWCKIRVLHRCRAVGCCIGVCSLSIGSVRCNWQTSTSITLWFPIYLQMIV
jgi:hypothetical protein